MYSFLYLGLRRWRIAASIELFQLRPGLWQSIGCSVNFYIVLAFQCWTATATTAYITIPIKLDLPHITIPKLKIQSQHGLEILRVSHHCHRFFRLCLQPLFKLRNAGLETPIISRNPLGRIPAMV
jgi:hypothetical protein